jgi:hypothetical protein
MLVVVVSVTVVVVAVVAVTVVVVEIIARFHRSACVGGGDERWRGIPPRTFGELKSTSAAAG